jgi:hypothetical protein
MRRIVLTFGLIGGAIISLMMTVGFVLVDRIGFESGEALGYTSMVLAFLMVYFGIRSFRDNVAGGTIRFKRAFTVGLLITLVTSACYVAAWEVIYYTGMAGDFVDKYTAHTLEKARADGASEAEIAKQSADMSRFMELYRNPFVNVGMTFLEILPVGIVMTLLSAAILRTRKPNAAGESIGGTSVVASSLKGRDGL